MFRFGPRLFGLGVIEGIRAGIIFKRVLSCFDPKKGPVIALFASLFIFTCLKYRFISLSISLCTCSMAVANEANSGSFAALLSG